MENDKRIVFNSSVNKVVIENRLAHFQNSLFDNSYLPPDKNYAITPRQIFMDLNFKNPICPEDNAFPSFICVPLKHLINKAGEHLDDLNLDYFYNVHKFYLNTSKKYTIKELYKEWKAKEVLAIKVKKKFKEELEGVELKYSQLYPERDLQTTTTCLTETKDSIVFGQHVVEEGYEIKEEEKTVLFFHYKFAKNLGIESEFEDVRFINKEKYYKFIPCVFKNKFFISNYTAGIRDKSVMYLHSKIEVNKKNKGLLFKTPNILQIKCENIKAYPHDSNFTKTIGVIKLNSENKYSSFSHTFKGNEFYPLENKLNETWEIKITDENNSRIKLYQGTPTILEISAIETNMENELNIKCTSEISEIYPNNCPTEFTSQQAQPIEISSITHEWQVALSSITFKNHFKMHSNLNLKFSYYCYDKDLKLLFWLKHFTIKETSIAGILKKFKKKLSSTIETMKKRHIREKRAPKGDITIVENEIIIQNEILQPKEDVIIENEILKPIEDVIIENENLKPIGDVRIENDILKINFQQATKITFTPHLAMILGLNRNSFDSDTDYNKESVKYEIGMKPNENNQYTGGEFSGLRPVDSDFNLTPKFMFIEMDAIKDIGIGNQNGKILKIVPLSKETEGRYVTEEFKNLDFHPLERHHLQKIDFKLRAQSGSLLQAHHTTDFNTTWMKLVFRKFPKK